MSSVVQEIKPRLRTTVSSVRIPSSNHPEREELFKKNDRISDATKLTNFPMANTSSKTGKIEPLLLKIGITLAVSAASGIYGIVKARGLSFPSFLNPFKPKSKLIENEKLPTQNQPSSIPLEEEEKISGTEGEKPKVEEVILSLKGRVEDLERKDLEIEKQFILYQNLKEREALLMELRNTLVLDMARINALEKEILLMEEENKKFESLVTEYLGVSEQLEGQKPENYRLLEREVKRLKKRLKDQSKITREKNLKIEENRTKLRRNNEEMETKKRMIEKLGNEVKELKIQMDQLPEEKNTSKIYAEKSVSVEDFNKLVNEFNQLKDKFEIEAEKSVTVEDFNKLSNEVNQLKDAFEVFKKQEQEQHRIEAEKSVTMEDFNELSNGINQLKDAFEVFKKQQQEQQGQKENPKEAARNHKALDQNGSSFDRTNSTRPKLLQRMSWGSEKMKTKVRPE